MEKNSLEETLQDAKLHRQLCSLIVAHLRDSNLYQAASAVASATMTSLNAEAPRNRLLQLVSKGTSVASRYGAIPATRTAAVDFGCARFSPDRKLVTTGSSDASIKLFEVSKIKQMMLVEARDGLVRPVIRTFDDHLQPVNDLDFHPQNTVLISGSKDETINHVAVSSSPKPLTINETGVHFEPLCRFCYYFQVLRFLQDDRKEGIQSIQDTHKVHSVCFHPSGDFLLAGTDHTIPHLYDVNTLQCYISANAPEIDVNGAINQVRYSATGGKYVTASKDGAIHLWDGVTAKCARSIPAHGTAEATSASFTKDQRFVLSSGKDSTVNLWEVGTGKLVKQYLGATHTQLWRQIVIWDAVTADKVAKWPSNHIGAFRWLAHSPTEAAFVTCGTDRSIRFWKESLSSL